jgi:hypothetical protein
VAAMQLPPATRATTRIGSRSDTHVG